MTGCEHICYVNCGLSGDDCHCYRVSMSPPGSLLPTIPTDAIAAREARDAQMRAEGLVAGLREAAKLYEDGAGPGAGGWDYFGDFRDAIRALADKIEGEGDE